jgi:uncharacterized protein (DUF1919 family)
MHEKVKNHFFFVVERSWRHQEPKLLAGAGAVIKFRLQVRHRNPYLNFYLLQERYMNKYSLLSGQI